MSDDMNFAHYIAIITIGFLISRSISLLIKQRTREKIEEAGPELDEVMEGSVGGGGGETANSIKPIVVTVALLAAGLYIILSNSYDPDSKKWAFGTVGMLAGYWLRMPS